MKRLIALILAICMLPVTGFGAADDGQLKSLDDTWYVYDTDDFESLDISTGSSLWDVDGWTPQARPSTRTMDSTLQTDPQDSSN